MLEGIIVQRWTDPLLKEAETTPLGRLPPETIARSLQAECWRTASSNFTRKKASSRRSIAAATLIWSPATIRCPGARNTSTAARFL